MKATIKTELESEMEEVKKMRAEVTRKKQSGFTLIELMIVVAIIGILAAIAIPQYQNYTGRAQAAEAITLFSGVKTSLAEYYNENDNWPTAAGSACGDDCNLAVGIDAASSIVGTYVSSVQVAGTGVVTATFGSGVHSGDTMTFTPDATNDGALSWTCASAAIVDSQLPSNCR